MDGQSYTVTKRPQRLATASSCRHHGLKEGEVIKPLTEEAYAKQQEAIRQQMMGKGGAAEKH